MLLSDCSLGCGDFRLHGIKIEARALLHRRKLDRSHRQLFNLLLDKYEAPEFVFEPVEVLLRAFLGPVVGPARALKRIEAQVGNVGYVRLGFVSEPPPRLVNETKLVVIDAEGAELAFAEVPDLVPVRRPLTGDHVHLIITIQMALEGGVADLFALLQLFADIRVARGSQKSREPVEAGDQAILDLARRHFTGPADHCWSAETAFHHRALALRERRLSAIGPGEHFAAVVGGEADGGI